MKGEGREKEVKRNEGEKRGGKEGREEEEEGEVR